MGDEGNSIFDYYDDENMSCISSSISGDEENSSDELTDVD
jgi:hypothetical protein